MKTEKLHPMKVAKSIEMRQEASRSGQMKRNVAMQPTSESLTVIDPAEIARKIKAGKSSGY